MDLKNKKRNILGIAIITIVFAVLSVFSIIKMYSEREELEKLQKKDYVLILEEELKIDLTGEDDFTDFEQVGYEMVVVPSKYRYYYKPCFDFVIKNDGIIITNRLAEEFDSFGFSVGDKIIKIDDEVLFGKTYFEILDLIYCKTENETKKFTLEDNTIIDYQYKNYKNKLEYNEEDNTLIIYNLDEVTVKAIFDVINAHPDLTLDLSVATVNTYQGIVNFLSLFSDKNESLFANPEGVVGQSNRKITDLNIVVKENNDKGILFTLTCLKTINKNILIDKTELNTTKFYVVKTLISSNYTIYLKNVLLEAKSGTSGGTILV